MLPIPANLLINVLLKIVDWQDMILTVSLSPHRKPRSPRMIRCWSLWAAGGIQWW